MSSNPVIQSIAVSCYRLPTDGPESDGTLEWDHTELVLVEVSAGGKVGLGYSYTSSAAAELITGALAPRLEGQPALGIEAAWAYMQSALRNVGVPGLGSMAIAAVDVALWDLKAKLLDCSLLDLFGAARPSVPVYGSGGFTSYTEDRLVKQLTGWAAQGMSRVKMKVGREPERDPVRVHNVRKALGANVALFVDANGAYRREQALELAERFAAESAVSWFEEPRPSNDLEGLRLLRDRAPGGMAIAAGEYGDTLDYFRRMLAAGAVDCLQADATRCGGFTGFLKVAALAQAFAIPLSAHCAPQLHAHVGCAVSGLSHVEYFYDHARIDGLIFDGALTPVSGALSPDPTRLGHGLALKRADAERYRV